MAGADRSKQFTLWEAACLWCDHKPADNLSDPTVQTVFSILVFLARNRALPATNVYSNESNGPRTRSALSAKKVASHPHFWKVEKQHLIKVAEQLRARPAFLGMGEPTEEAKPLGTLERETLLTIVGALARVSGYSDKTYQSANKLLRAVPGLRLTAETISEKIKLGYQYLPAIKKPENENSN